MFNHIGWYFKFIGKLFHAKLTKRPVPLIVILGVTNKCNLKCWYCYGEHSHRFDWPDFTTEELLDLISVLHKMGTRILQLQGGEPLLRDDLSFIINKAHNLGMMCDMVTNGILIPKKKEVVGLLDKICISLDGPDDINDLNRGKGTHRQIMEGIKEARNLGIPVRISAVLTAESKKEDIDWLLSFASKYNSVVNFSPSFDFIPQIRNSTFKPHDIPDDCLHEIFRYIQTCKADGAAVQFTTQSYAIASKWPFSYRERTANRQELSSDFIHPRCYHGEYIFFIDSDGSVYPCCNFWGRATYNIRTHGVQKSILNVKRDGCEACYIPAYIDRNLFFDGMPSVWWNYIKQAVRRKI